MSIARPRNILSTPGVYFFRDKSGRILYLGKAANLKNRIKSYFSRQNDPRPHTKRASVTKSPDFNNARYGVGARISKMLETAKSIDWQETDSEIEALILESQLIKKYRPPFNIMLRDDKQYFYVAFTKEEFPKLVITHQPLNAKRYSLNASFIGPFTDGIALKTTLKLLRKIFPYCTCKQKHNNFCLNYHIGNCPGFCCLKKGTTAKQVSVYKKNITAIKEILSGKKKSLIKKFEKEMNVFAKKGNLEKAIELRDKIEKLKKIFENARIISKQKHFDISKYQSENNEGVLEELRRGLGLKSMLCRIEGYDVSNIQGEFATGAMVVFTDGRPDKNEYRKFRIRIAGKANDIAMLKEVLMRRFRHPEWPYPDLVLIDGGKGQLNAAKAAMSKSKCQMSNKISAIALTKDAEHKGHHIYVSAKKMAVPLKNLPLAVRNLILQIDAEAHRFAIGYYRKLHRQILK